MDLDTIDTVLSWTCKISKVVAEYIQAVRHVPDVITQISAQVNTWKLQMDILRILIERGELPSHVSILLQSKDLLGDARDCLAQLEVLINQAPRPRAQPGLSLPDFWARATWPITSKDQAKDLLGRLDRHRQEIQLALQTTSTMDLGDIRRANAEINAAIRETANAQLTAQEQQEVLSWLKPDFPKDTDPETLQNEKFNLQEEDTCDWMVKSGLWRDWLEGGPSSPAGCHRFLWIHGLPGSGKTILASYLIDQIGRHCTSKGYSHYYCSHDHNRDETMHLLQWVVRDLIIQLGRCIPGENMPPKLLEMRQYRRKTIPDLKRCLQEITWMFFTRLSKRVYIVIDGVDESKTPRTKLLQVLTDIGTNPEYEHVSLLITSRYEQDIRGAIERLPKQLTPLRKGPAGKSPARARSNHPADSPFRHQDPVLFPGVPEILSPYESPSMRLHTNIGASFSSPGSVPVQASQDTDVDMTGDDSMAETVNIRQNLARTPSPTKGKRSASGNQESRSPSPQKRRISAGGSHVDVGRDGDREEDFGSVEPDIPCTILSMSNTYVKKAIETFIQGQLNNSERFAQWPRPEFIERLKVELAAKAGGMFRTVTCHLDMIERLDLTDEPTILKEINDMPGIIFEMYEKIIIDGIIPREAGDKSRHNKEFARTALALICSNTSQIPDAGVLVEAARLDIPQSIAQDYNFKKLERLLGCLARVTGIRRKPRSPLYRRDDDDSNGSRLHVKRFQLAHYTVKEYLYHPKTAAGPARDFALTNEGNQILELRVVFYGLRNYSAFGSPPKKIPSRFDEYCLRMTEQALCNRPDIVVKVGDIGTAVWPCLLWNAPHQSAIRNRPTRDAFPKWYKLASAFEEGYNPGRTETCVLVSLILLQWPELAKVYLESLATEVKEKIWKDKFALREADDSSKTVLQMIVSQRSLDFLEVAVEAGATFMDEPDILFRALEDPYGNSDDETCAFNPTRILLSKLLDRGANPNPPGYRVTPLQIAVRHLEPRWVSALLVAGANPDVLGDAEGVRPPGQEYDRSWHKKLPMDICLDGNIRLERGQEEDDYAEVRKNRRRVKEILLQHKNNELIIETNDDD